jgi:hypothetical protein
MRWQHLIFNRNGYGIVRMVSGVNYWHKAEHVKPAGSFSPQAQPTTGSAAPAESIELQPAGENGEKVVFQVTRQSPDEMVLTGDFMGARVEARVRRVPRESFQLVNRGFRWVQQ